jgi:hypothetical protein
MGASAVGAGVDPMPTDLTTAITKYLKAGNPRYGTQSGYRTTLKKWKAWGGGAPIEHLTRREIRDFLDWVYDQAVSQNGANPGRTSNKARANLRAVMSWAWEQDIVEALPRFPKAREARQIAGRHYFTKPEINALYFATFELEQPVRWSHSFTIGRYWRAALVLFFNYGLDTGTVWKVQPYHQPILWRHVSWEPECPDPQLQQTSRWGWIYYRRTKTGKCFYRPMNRVVHAHMKSVLPADPDPSEPVLFGGGGRPNFRFRELCRIAGVHAKTDVETGEEGLWVLKDLRKTCGTFYDQHVPESSIEILGHAVQGATYRHYAHRAPLAYKAIMTLPQPTAFTALLNGDEGECPCCRRKFADP